MKNDKASKEFLTIMNCYDMLNEIWELGWKLEIHSRYYLDKMAEFGERLSLPTTISKKVRFFVRTEEGIVWRGGTYHIGVKSIESSWLEQFFIRFGGSMTQRVPTKYKSKPCGHNTLADLEKIYTDITQFHTELMKLIH